MNVENNIYSMAHGIVFSDRGSFQLILGKLIRFWSQNILSNSPQERQGNQPNWGVGNDSGLLLNEKMKHKICSDDTINIIIDIRNWKERIYRKPNWCRKFSFSLGIKLENTSKLRRRPPAIEGKTKMKIILQYLLCEFRKLN